MSSETAPVIEARGLGKTYRMYAHPADRLKQALFRGRRYYTEFRALAGVDFSMPAGEAMGIVGVNGAGKSTLLQLIAGTIQPSEGDVRTRGRVAALLELGSGFNPEFTGRENIYLNAATLGLLKREIDERVESIIAFSGVGQHIDQPVKTYSSGMHVRLAFAIATSVEPDILIIDEALSVGDGAFARRSFDRIMQIKERGATVLFCSHALFHVDVFCDRAIWLHEGRVQEIGPVTPVLGRYQEFLDGLAEGPARRAPSGETSQLDPSVATVGAALASEPGFASAPAAAVTGAASLRGVRVSLDGRQGDELYGDAGRSTLRVEIDFASDPAMPAPTAALVISSEGGRILAAHASAGNGTELARNADGTGTADVIVERIPLNKGRYRIGAYLLCERGVHVYQWIDPVAHVSLHADKSLPGYFQIDAHWRSGSDAAARHWDRWQAARAGQRPAMTDWGDHPEVLRLVFERAFGRAGTDLVGFLRDRFGESRGRALSLCCGDGAFEKTLLAQDVFDRIDGLDISPARVAAGSTGPQADAGRLALRVADVNDGDFGVAQYDAVIAKASLHHVHELERVLDGIARCLKPGGRLATLDFFGPTRFQWTDRQLAEANRFLDDEVPAALKRRADGSSYRATRPGVEEMIAMDPSEAVRSGELYELLRSRFVLEADLPLGGTLLNLILHADIVDNFDPADPAHNELIRRAFARERELIDSGALDSDFRLIVARPK